MIAALIATGPPGDEFLPHAQVVYWPVIIAVVLWFIWDGLR